MINEDSKVIMINEDIMLQADKCSRGVRVLYFYSKKKEKVIPSFLKKIK